MEKRGAHGRSGRGQALVELALVLPIFLLITVATVDAGRAFTNQVAISNASREGAIYASMGNSADSAGIRNRVLQAASGIDPASISVSTTSDGSTVTVTVTCSMALVTPLIGAIWGNPVPLRAATTAAMLA